MSRAGIDTLVEGLCHFLLHESIGDLTVGIYGAWGSGKSTLMQQLMWRMVCHQAAEEYMQHDEQPHKWEHQRPVQARSLICYCTPNAICAIMTRACSGSHHLSSTTVCMQDETARQLCFESKRHEFVQHVASDGWGSEEVRKQYRKMAMPRVMVVWFNAWECTSAQDTWARYALI